MNNSNAESKMIKVYDQDQNRWKDVDAGPIGKILGFLKIGPTLATQFLSNQANRKQKIAKIRQMSRDMKKGDWGITPNMIGFYADGSLADGQNRLQAIVESGTEQLFAVVYGETPKEMEKADCGTSRNLHDIAVLSGMKDVHTFTVSVARFLRRETIQHLPRQATRSEELSFLKENRTTLDYLTSIFRPVDKSQKKSVIPFNVGNDVGSAFFRAFVAFGNDHEKLNRVQVLAKALVDDDCYLTLSLSKSPEDSAFKLLTRHFQKDDAQGQAGRNRRYFKTENAILNFVNRNPISRLHEASEELFLLPCELEAKNTKK